MLMKREYTDTIPSGPSKKLKTSSTSDLMWSSISPLDKLQAAFSTVLAHQAKALDVLQSTREWDVARNVLLKTEMTRKYIAKERLRYVVAKTQLTRANNEEKSKSKKKKNVSFGPIVTIYEADDMDRCSPEIEPPSVNELLVIKAVGLRRIPLQNFSELW
ncbi:hypothetical protein THRCLA_05999 [Thraustotheca clavata]|uniref:Uncharacterized protein n=1 Tax=Thraustotheca clavata TaxID=74557 RepID=A0A1V9ZQT8_9STRA|nr:hypothetical protein THRCLA_05999 [Thraustotheca clavata]